MVSRILYREKYIYSDGAVREMILWQLPRKTPDRPYGLKYRLYYGLGDGTCLVRFDNESGKGDHKHVGSQEESYRFIDVETLVADFLAEITQYFRPAKLTGNGILASQLGMGSGFGRIHLPPGESRSWPRAWLPALEELGCRNGFADP